jgi:small-conductance mechanosensitive channel
VDRYVNDFGDEEEGAAQGLLTRLSVAKRLVTLIAVLVTLGVILIQLGVFEKVGYTLLASAGVASIIVGIAAQPVLGNLIAGLQIGLTQPVRIGDSVVFEGNWGHVEEIAFSYLTIRTWDKRRIIVPLQYLVSRPIENWTKTSSHLIKPIYLYVDYRTDVEQIREKFNELLRNADGWDEETDPVVQVTGCSDETMEVRALCSAKDPATAWDLHCQMREELIRYVQQLDDGRYLPRQRLRVEGGDLVESNGGKGKRQRTR